MPTRPLQPDRALPYRPPWADGSARSLEALAERLIREHLRPEDLLLREHPRRQTPDTDTDGIGNER